MKGPSLPVRERFRRASGAFGLVVSGPSGVGKTSICKAILERVPLVRSCVTTTTRPPRQGEVDGRDYHFVSEEAFDALGKKGAFLEQATVHGHRYGCTVDAVAAALEQSLVVLLEVDVQGARTWRDVLGPYAVTVFVLPPSVEELSRRLRARRSESREALELRLRNALREIGEAPRYDYVVVNQDLSEAVSGVEHIIEAEKQRTARAGHLLDALTTDAG